MVKDGGRALRRAAVTLTDGLCRQQSERSGVKLPNRQVHGFATAMWSSKAAEMFERDRQEHEACSSGGPLAPLSVMCR
jgi:hypothetical protein